MNAKSIIALGASVFVVVGILNACGGSPAAPTPTPNTNPSTTPAGGTLTIKGATTPTGALSGLRSLFMNAPPMMLPGTPTSLKVRMQKLYVSSRADCSSLTLVQDKGAGADYQDLVLKPALLSGSVSADSYNCLAMKISDIMKFTPDSAAAGASAGVCVAGREVDFDILKVENPPESWYDPETNSSFTGAGSHGAPMAQDVFLFISTNPSAITAANPRVHVHQLVTLTNPITVRASQVTLGAFVFDASNRIAVTTGGAGDAKWCWLEGAVAQFVGQ